VSLVVKRCILQQNCLKLNGLAYELAWYDLAIVAGWYNFALSTDPESYNADAERYRKTDRQTTGRCQIADHTVRVACRAACGGAGA